MNLRMNTEPKDWTIVKSGIMRGEKTRYHDGVGYTIWSTFRNPDNPEEECSGICFDYSEKDADDVLRTIMLLKEAKENVYIPDPKEEKKDEEFKRKTNTWWYKAWHKLDDVGITVTPFYWRFRPFFVVRPIPLKNTYAFQWCRGFFLGPITITW